MKNMLGYILKGLVASCAVLGHLTAGASETVEPRATTLRPMTVNPAPTRPTDLDEDGENLYILDSEGHRVLVMRDGTVVRAIGGIGNAPGELYYPTAMSVTSDGLLVLRDNGNHRLQFLGRKGRYLGEIPQWKIWGLAAYSTRVYVGQPENGNLIEIFGTPGKRIAAMGDLLSPAELVGDAVGEHENIYRKALNRVLLTTDKGGNVWAAFQHVALLRKYSATGELLLEVKIDLPGIDILERSVLEPDTRPAWAASINIDGVQLTIVSRDIKYDRRSNTIMVLTGYNQVAGFTSEGRLRYVAIFPKVDYTLTAVSSTPDGTELVLSSSASPVLVGEHPALYE